MTNAAHSIELGSVTSATGRLLIIDMGLLDLWSGLGEPVMNERFGRAVMETANSGSDYEIQGPDAIQVGQALGMQWHPRFLYDIPASRHAEVAGRLDDAIRRCGGDARLVQVPARVPHEERLQAALEFGHGGGVVQFQGVPAIAIDTKVQDLSALVVATPDEDGRWLRITLSIADGTPSRRRLVGHVGVDEARLCVVDPVALRAWEHEEPIDGLADFVFWGRDADHVAASFSAAQLGNGTFGWQDVPVEECADRGVEIEQYLQEHTDAIKVRYDFRPHSHHYQVLRQIWKSETEAGQLELAGQRLTGFMTKCGDGFFPVYLETTEDDVALAVTIELTSSRNEDEN